MSAAPQTVKNDYKVKDITLAEWGKHLRTTAGEGLSARFFLFKPDLKNVCLPFSRQLEAVFHQERCQAVFIH